MQGENVATIPHNDVVENGSFLLFSELCLGKAMLAYTWPQQRKKEESEWLRGGDQILVDLRFERG